MRKLIMWLWVIGVFLFLSGIGFAQTCPMSKAKEGETAEKQCGKVIADCIGNKVVCPVMGTVFNIDKDTKSYEHDGKIYYFCCPGCVDKFKAEPEKYKQK